MPSLFVRNGLLKLAALAVAVLLWLLLRVEDANRQEISDIPIEVELLDPGWAMVGNPLPAAIQVRFSGPSRELVRMAMERPVAVVPVEEIPSEDTTVAIRNEWIRTQERSGVVVEDVEPRNVRLTFEPVERLTVPVAARTQGVLPAHLAFSGEPQPTPSEVAVAGPRSRLEGLDTLTRQPVALGGLEGPTSRRVPVDSAGVTGLEVSPPDVTVMLPVEERVEETLDGLGVELIPVEAAGDLEVVPDTLSLTASGPRSVMAALDLEDLRVTVELGDQFQGDEVDEVSLPVVLHGVPEYLEAAPEVDSVTVRRPTPETPQP